jgi:hypothetical protein
MPMGKPLAVNPAGNTRLAMLAQLPSAMFRAIAAAIGTFWPAMSTSVSSPIFGAGIRVGGKASAAIFLREPPKDETLPKRATLSAAA